MLVSTSFARRSVLRFSLVALTVTLVASGCSGTTDPVVNKAITELTGPSAAVSVGQGFSTKTIISIKRSSTFDGAVQLAAEGLPTGLLVSFAPASLSSTATLAEMSISALINVAPGAHSFTVKASGEGVASKTTTVNVLVTVPAITVAATTTSPTVMQGSTLDIPITITREGGFTGIVGLSALGLPAGVTAVFAPVVLEPGATTSTLTLSAPLTVQPIVKAVTLRASAQGLTDQTIPLQLTVAPTTTPAVLVSVNPTFLNVDGGSFVETQVTLQRLAGFDGAVNITVDGLPANISATADPIAAGANVTTLRLTVGEQEPGGNYQLSVKANGTGIQQASTGLAVQTRLMPRFDLVFRDEAAPPAEQFKLSIPVTIARGSAATIMPLQVFRLSQYNLPVALTLVGAPAGVTSNLPTTIPGATTSQTFVINISVAADVAPGVYNLTVRGETTTPMTREVTVVLTVN